jgi:hypothetical protein
MEFGDYQTIVDEFYNNDIIIYLSTIIPKDLSNIVISYAKSNNIEEYIKQVEQINNNNNNLQFHALEQYCTTHGQGFIYLNSEEINKVKVNSCFSEENSHKCDMCEHVSDPIIIHYENNNYENVINIEGLNTQKYYNRQGDGWEINSVRKN